MACDDPARRQALAKALNTCFVFIGSLAVSLVWVLIVGLKRLDRVGLVICGQSFG